MPRIVNRVHKNLGMLDEHRAIIRKHYETLVTECDIQKLIPLFLDKKIFTPEMIQYHTGTNDLETKKSIFNSITKRGPKAFENFIQSLKETNQHSIAYTLTNDTNDNVRVSSNVSRGNGQVDNRPRHAVLYQLPSYEDSNVRNIPNLSDLQGNVHLGTTPLTVTVKNAIRLYDTDFEHNYQTHSKARGAVLIINNRKFINDVEPVRNGAEHDDHNLKELFKQMNFSYQVYTDLTSSEMVAAITDFTQDPKLSNVDMLFLFIMSHGKNTANGAVVICTDNMKIETEWIEEQFNNQNCKYMQKKPKILVFQICRGEDPDRGTMHARVETDNVRSGLRTLSDTLVAHSTLSGYSSHRDIYLGSWYIQLICEVFMNNAHFMHIEEMLKYVDRELEKLRSESMTMQTSTFTNKGFNKSCFLHPGIYLENGELKTYK